MKKNRSKKRPDKNIRNKKTVIRYFKTIVKKRRYKDTLDVNEKGIPVIKGTDFPVSQYLFITCFLGYSDEDLETAFNLKMNKELLSRIREDVIFFSVDILEFLFEKEMERYQEELYITEMGCSGCGWI